MANIIIHMTRIISKQEELIYQQMRQMEKMKNAKVGKIENGKTEISYEH